MSEQGEMVKQHAEHRLDREAAVHRSGHQNVHARRYVMPRVGGVGVEVMIIVKGAHLQLWCEGRALERAFALGLHGEFRSGSEVYSALNSKGETLYGRHHGLKLMGHLHRGDAWRFKPKTIGEVDRILDGISGRGAR